MRAIDYSKALGLAIVVLVITLIASFPMVAFYSYFIEPGQPQEFYNDAAQWIAPWSSHILGPILFFFGTYRIVRNNSHINGLQFVAATIVLYLVVDFGLVGLAIGMSIMDYLEIAIILSMLVKIIAAIVGAHLGSKNRTVVSSEAKN